MNNLLYTIAVVLVVFWAIGFFYFGVQAVIHILLVIALISIMIKLNNNRKPKEKV